MTRSLRPLLACFALVASAADADAAAFARADGDRDGYVAYRDAKRALPQLSEVHFVKFDYDGDGLVSQKEWVGLNNFYTVFYLAD